MTAFIGISTWLPLDADLPGEPRDLALPRLDGYAEQVVVVGEGLKLLERNRLVAPWLDRVVVADWIIELTNLNLGRGDGGWAHQGRAITSHP